MVKYEFRDKIYCSSGNLFFPQHRFYLAIYRGQQFVSDAIARDFKLRNCGRKVVLQILLALLFLKEKKWSFIYGISLVCLVGSVILLPYCVARLLGFADNSAFFVGSLIAAVLCMLALYYRTVRKNQVGLHWVVFFAIALFAAVSLQLTLVFQVIKL